MYKTSKNKTYSISILVNDIIKTLKLSKSKMKLI